MRTSKSNRTHCEFPNSAAPTNRRTRSLVFGVFLCLTVMIGWTAMIGIRQRNAPQSAAVTPKASDLFSHPARNQEPTPGQGAKTHTHAAVDAASRPLPDDLMVKSQAPYEQTQGGNADLRNLPSPEQVSLAKAICDARHAVDTIDPEQAAIPVNGGARYFASNPGQRITARFLDGGVRFRSGRPDEDWQGTLRYGGLGEAGHDDSPSKPQPIANKNRVEYLHGDGVTEWFENKPEGIEHGYTISERPESAVRSGELRLNTHLEGLSISPDPGVPDAEDHSLGLVDDRTGQTVLRYGKLAVWDAAGRRIPARLEGSATTIAIVVREPAASYPLLIDPLLYSHHAKVYPGVETDGSPDEEFGTAVALGGSGGNTALIGAALEGAAYVLTREGSS